MKSENFKVYMHISPSKKVYIGITCEANIEDRWKKGKGYKHSPHFTTAINKYGWDNFKHLILYTNLTQDEACEKELN